MIMYFVDYVSLNINKLLITIALIISVYGSIKNSTAMKESVQEIYHEIKSNTHILSVIELEEK